MRAWAYYNLFEIWGGALPFYTASGGEVPGSADADWATSCKKIYDFICTELDESNDVLPKETGDNRFPVRRDLLETHNLLHSLLLTLKAPRLQVTLKIGRA